MIVMDNEILRENIKSLEKIIKNLRSYMTEQEKYVEEMKQEVSDTEEDLLILEDLRDHYKRTLNAREQSKLMKQRSA